MRKTHGKAHFINEVLPGISGESMPVNTKTTVNLAQKNQALEYGDVFFFPLVFIL